MKFTVSLKVFNLALRNDLFNLKLIQVKNKQIENAMKLAEKYVDFTTLVLICELKSDTDLLESYLDKFCESVKFFFHLISRFKLFIKFFINLRNLLSLWLSISWRKENSTFY